MVPELEEIKTRDNCLKQNNFWDSEKNKCYIVRYKRKDECNATMKINGINEPIEKWIDGKCVSIYTSLDERYGYTKGEENENCYSKIFDKEKKKI